MSQIELEQLHKHILFIDWVIEVHILLVIVAVLIGLGLLCFGLWKPAIGAFFVGAVLLSWLGIYYLVLSSRLNSIPHKYLREAHLLPPKEQ